MTMQVMIAKYTSRCRCGSKIKATKHWIFKVEGRWVCIDCAGRHDASACHAAIDAALAQEKAEKEARERARAQEAQLAARVARMSERELLLELRKYAGAVTAEGGWVWRPISGVPGPLFEAGRRAGLVYKHPDCMVWALADDGKEVA